MLKSYLMQMLLLVLREQCEPVKNLSGRAFESASRKYVVEQIVSYLEEHYSEKISLDQIAENMYFSPYYISKIFKLETGDTLIRHLINIRLERARELLEHGWGESIQEVAAAVGYEDAYHFSKLFKKHYGISPSQAKLPTRVKPPMEVKSPMEVKPLTGIKPPTGIKSPTGVKPPIGGLGEK